MKKATDTKVRKTLVRDCEKLINPSVRNPVVRDVNSKIPIPRKSPEKDLNKPTLCSSVALANYLSDVRIELQPPAPSQSDVSNIDRDQLSAKVTKKLNFHFDDKIYKNLIELNNTVEQTKKSKDKRTTSINKKDLEPNIDDFYEDTIDQDSPPSIPILKPKSKMAKKIEHGHLHRLVSAFETL